MVWLSQASPLSAALPTPLSQFGNLPCLAPLIRAVDPAAPKNIGEALLLPPYRAPDFSGEIGTVHFPISGADAVAQSTFDRGVAFLHGFADDDAERCFRAVASAIPGHPMPYWGMAMANEREPGRAAVYADYARHLAGSFADLSPWERAWVSLAKAHFDGGSAAERVAALEDLAYAWPDAPEPRAFLLRALVLDEYRAGLPVRSHLAVDALATGLVEAHPGHPAANYRPLLWLRDRPARASGLADAAPAAAPGSAGSWRVAAEAFAAAGEHGAALAAQEVALRLDSSKMRRELGMPDEYPEAVAGIAAHVESLIATGQTRAALDLARHLIALPRLPGGDVHRTGRRLFASALMRGGRWDELAAECRDPEGVLAPQEPWIDPAENLYWQGIARWQGEHPGAAEEAQAMLEAHFRRFLSEGTTAEVEKSLASIVKSARNFGDLFRNDPPTVPDAPLLHVGRSQLALLLAGRGALAAALSVADADLADRPAVPEAIATFCAVAELAGRGELALPHFDTAFRRNASLADRDHPLFGTALNPVVERLGLRGRWTLAPESSERPASPPDAVHSEPVRWFPPEAPDFDLPGVDGARRSLVSLRGRPVVAIFFVGIGCPFCAEQLKAFEPHAAGFRAADIEIVTISTDPVSAQRATVASATDPPVPQPLPFPILADPELEAFRAYRCVDPFNDRALHGIYLIDPAGRILWDSIGHDPFLDPEFLLAESRRLLRTWAE